ncbi:helix-turn-helix domain-containing protein [Paraburkholderia sp. SIMBA_055]|jgi:DNA-binding HxlR family transcriptional regulator|uniref:Transcriptional regulator, HxlR family n=2 Tax=Paraburkholderia graminis TaxID=60548 RepID=B1FXQ9_PARG4|nr:helix-turn-helix domain-containing protein [Paraburkholderia graminis]ALE54126.1 transcriptional regulator [Burkholderia sp. HB1]AXF07403.1 transcriptional regulator [Paraburkholderia graminis]EDT11235.1 transcriptional regulator, HxlR family [Paraburkholderia graminis C4D1M]MDQ0622349.1 DNA-binding HxlR family transcriptional regulator [Paraburkholderia graminis]MDR6207475.1 DNA-binding HxlR family transcriptional regulator [Paraburkholderia graminis]
MKTTCKEDLRSHCAVNYGVEIFGDRWSLLIIRDIVFAGKKTYGEFLKSEEGIATNVLATRLAFLEEQGILSKAPSPEDRRKDFYTLTEKGLDLIPIVLSIVVWSARHDSKSYVRRRKDFVARLKASPVQVSEEVKELVRNGGCIFPESRE